MSRFTKLPLVIGVALCLVDSCVAQESLPTNQLTRQRIQLQMEYQFHRTKLLKERVQLLELMHKLAEQESQVTIERQKLQADALSVQEVEAEAMLKQAQTEWKRAESLAERNVISAQELEKAKHIHSMMTQKHRLSQLKKVQLEQELKVAGSTAKRQPLEIAVQLKAAQLELLEAEYRVKELKLMLTNQGE